MVERKRLESVRTGQTVPQVRILSSPPYISRQVNNMINIRKASLKDLNNIQKLNHEVMSANIEFDPNINPDFDLGEAGEILFKEALTNSDGIFLLAFDDEKLVGYINGEPREIPNREIKTFEIDNLGVIPEYRKHGIATMLYNKIVEEIKTRGFKKLYLNCYVQNTNALNFYKNLGFEPIDISLEKDI